MNPNGEAPFLNDDQLRGMVGPRAQADLAQRLGGAHMQHAEADAMAGVFHDEITRLRNQVLDALELDLKRQQEIAELRKTVAVFRQQLGLPPEDFPADGEDPLEGRRTDAHAPRRHDHRFAAAHVAPHDRERLPGQQDVLDAADVDDAAHDPHQLNLRTHAAFEAKRQALGREELTDAEIAEVQAALAADAPGEGPIPAAPLEDVNGRLA